MEEFNVLFEIKKIHQLIGKRLFERYHKEKCLGYPSPLQMEIIDILIKREEEEVYIKNIRKDLGISKAATSDAIEKMLKKNYIEKQECSSDGRKAKIILKEEGKKMFLALKDDIDEMNQEMKVNISLKELECFTKICHKIEKNLEKEGKE